MLRLIRLHPPLIRGSLHTASNSLDVGRGKHVKDAVMKAPQFKRPKDSTQEQWVVSILEKNQYTLKKLKTAMASKVANGSEKL